MARKADRTARTGRGKKPTQTVSVPLDTYPVYERLVEAQARENMIAYGMEVNTNRMLPDIRDGFKPVQRKAMWACWLKKATSDHNYKVAGSIVSSIIDFHPHEVSGDVLVPLCQDTNRIHRGCMYPLLEGMGNWGSHNDYAAADRYKSLRLSKFGDRVFDTLPVIEMGKDYKGENEEPVAFMPRVPLLFLNGTSGIGVGLANQCPAHNLSETIDLLQAHLKGEELTWDLFWKYIKGPEHEWGGFLKTDRKRLKEIYEKGQGSLQYSCEYHYEKTDKGEHALVITGFGPNWLGDGGKNYDDLKQKGDWLVTQGALLRVSVETRFDDIRLVFVFNNHHIIEKEILPLLNSSQSYNCYVTFRKWNEQEEDVDVEIYRYTLLEFLQSWVQLWKPYELALLQYQERDIYQKLIRASARFIAVSSLDVIARALKAEKGAKDILLTELGMNEEQAEYILDTPFRTLQRINLQKLEEDYSRLEADLKENRNNQANLDQYLIGLLEDFRQYDYHGRLLKIGDNIIPECPKTDNQLWARADSNSLYKTATPPERVGWAYADITDGLITVNKHGIVKNWTALDIKTTGTPNQKDCVGIVSKSCPAFLVASKGGLFLILPTNLSGEYQAFLDNSEITGAYPIFEGDSLAIRNNRTGAMKIVACKDLPITRKRKARGQTFLWGKKGADDGASFLLFNQKTDILLDAQCQPVSIEDWFLSGKYVLGQRNFILSQQKAYYLNQEEALKFLKQKASIVKNIIKAG